MTAPSGPKVRRPRWGWRTLGFIVLSIVAMVTAQVQGFHTLGTAGCTLFGVLGAGYCSYRGLRSVAGTGWPGH